MMEAEAGPSRLPAPPPPPFYNSQPKPKPKPKPKPEPKSNNTAVDPILRNALRYTISAREYEKLHKYVLSKSRLLKKRMPSVNAVEDYMDGPNAGKGSVAGRDRDASITGGGQDKENRKGKGKGKEKGRDVAKNYNNSPTRKGGDTFNARAIRHALRVFIATGLGMKAYEVAMARLKGGKDAASNKKREPFYKSATLRLSLSLSTILLLYRLLFRFLHRLRAHLLDPSAAPFRDRNPATSKTLTSPYAPAVGASLAGLALGIYPAQKLRVSVAILALFRAMEFGWNLLEDEGAIWGWKARANDKGLVKRERPWWWGSWLLQPFAFGQLFHAAVFDPECTPMGLIDTIWKNTSTYLHSAPENLPAGLHWPNSWEILDNLAKMAKLNWPPYVAPALFPNQPTLPPSLEAVAPLTNQAHPLITSLSCAALHPSDPSCLRTYVTFWARSFPHIGRSLLLLYSVLMLPRYKQLYNAPLQFVRALLARALRLSTFATGAMSTVWASVCLFQGWLPRGLLPTQRFFLGGFLAGLWAFADRAQGRAAFLYTARASVDSLWKVGVKRRWWKAMRGGDLWIFVLALAATGAVYERDACAVREAGWRRGISFIRGTGFRDWGFDEDDDADEDGDRGADGVMDDYKGEALVGPRDPDRDHLE